MERWKYFRAPAIAGNARWQQHGVLTARVLVCDTPEEHLALAERVRRLLPRARVLAAGSLVETLWVHEATPFDALVIGSGLPLDQVRRLAAALRPVPLIVIADDAHAISAILDAAASAVIHRPYLDAHLTHVLWRALNDASTAQ